MTIKLKFEDVPRPPAYGRRAGEIREYVRNGRAKPHTYPAHDDIAEPTPLRVMAHFLFWLENICNDLHLNMQEDELLLDNQYCQAGMSSLEDAIRQLKRGTLSVLNKDLVRILEKF